MRRFDYVSYITPDDPKKLRLQSQGKFRTAAAATFREVAEAFVGGDRDAIEGNLDKKLSTQAARNEFQFKYRSASPYPCQVHIEMQEVAEGPTHPLSREGFVAWAEDRVNERPLFEGRPNTIELELAGALHQVQSDRLAGFKEHELRAWLADLLWGGRRGLVEYPRDELLHEIEAEIIETADDEWTTVEDALE